LVHAGASKDIWRSTMIALNKVVSWVKYPLASLPLVL
jgi:hypothetical protein